MSATQFDRSLSRTNAGRARLFDAIVVGSGIGGLAAAALLAKYGKKRVLVLERHYAIGGFTHTFHRPGYEWDVGVHYLGDLQPGGLLRSVFDEVSDAKLEWADMGPVYDRVIIGDETFDFPKGEDQLKAALVGRFPDEAAAIERYFELVRRVQSCLPRYFLEKALPSFVSMLLGPFLRWPFLRYSDKTLRDVLEGLTQNKKLRAVLRRSAVITGCRRARGVLRSMPWSPVTISRGATIRSAERRGLPTRLVP